MVAMILVADLHVPSVLIMFGAMQIFTGLVYKIPMPAQPLKAMAAIVISQQLGGNLLLAAGLGIGVIMLILSVTGTLDKLARWVPKPVIRGIQLGLGISLCLLALNKYIPEDPIYGYLIAGIAFIIIILFIDNRRYPASLIVIAGAALYTIIVHFNADGIWTALGFNLPKFHLPEVEDVAMGFLLLALPQIPLSLGNSIISTRQVAQDLFPENDTITIRKIGITYALMNIVNPFLSGIPVCHGSGGMVGHYTFGGRTGGSVILYGSMFLILGFFFSDGFQSLIEAFPLPVLGVILMFEGLSLMLLVRDTAQDKKGFVVALLVGIIAFGVPYGFVISMIIGTAIWYAPINLETLSNLGKNPKD